MLRDDALECAESAEDTDTCDEVSKSCDVLAILLSPRCGSNALFACVALPTFCPKRLFVLLRRSGIEGSGMEAGNAPRLKMLFRGISANGPHNASSFSTCACGATFASPIWISSVSIVKDFSREILDEVDARESEEALRSSICRRIMLSCLRNPFSCSSVSFRVVSRSFRLRCASQSHFQADTNAKCNCCTRFFLLADVNFRRSSRKSASSSRGRCTGCLLRKAGASASIVASIVAFCVLSSIALPTMSCNISSNSGISRRSFDRNCLRFRASTWAFKSSCSRPSGSFAISFNSMDNSSSRCWHSSREAASNRCSSSTAALVTARKSKTSNRTSSFPLGLLHKGQ
mmetsp:Transcript_7029/g.11327  ORF Transcript_7029/g.11327 Transcript_7029/m.11327 type:complete len:345 (+) Transcript_7029:388-1422(+)